jgi:hypothetical protein
MLCGEASLVNRGWDGIQAVSLRCRAWTCPDCRESRRKQLVALALSGKPNKFITLTVNPAWGSSPYERARALADAWRVVVRLAKTKYSLKSLPYLCVFEACESGEPHLHILARVEWISHSWLREQMQRLINAPIVEVQEVKNKKKLAYYISKYIGKDPQRFHTCKRYWSTRDWELTSFEPEVAPGRWHRRWTLVRTPLSALAEEWRSQGLDVEVSRHRILSTWSGPPDDVVFEVAEYWRRLEGWPRCRHSDVGL